MGAAGVKMAGLFQEQDCHERNEQRDAQDVESVAEGQNKRLLLHDVADGDERTVRGTGAVGDAVIDEILREQVEPGAGGLRGADR